MSVARKCYLRVVNWELFQHYGDRTPPWIKLHNTVLEDPVIAALPDHSKAHVFGIWILASRLKNKIPNDPGFISNRINATTRVDLKALIYASFLEHHPECECGATDLLAKCSTEKEEKESRREEEKSPAALRASEAVLVIGPKAETKRTWLTPFGDAWSQRFGAESTPPWGEMAQHLKQPYAQLGGAELLARWVRFLAATERSQWARAARFVQGLGEWATLAPARPPPSSKAKARDESDMAMIRAGLKGGKGDGFSVGGGIGEADGVPALPAGRDGRAQGHSRG